MISPRPLISPIPPASAVADQLQFEPAIEFDALHVSTMPEKGRGVQ